MQTPRIRREFPRVLIFAVAITAGVLAALAVQIALSAAGFEPAASWRQVFSTKAQLRTAGPWWAIAGAAFIAAGLTGSALSRLPPPWRGLRLLRWSLAALSVFVLAHIGHAAAGLAPAEPGPAVAANLVALAVAALMALLGAFLTARR